MMTHNHLYIAYRLSTNIVSEVNAGENCKFMLHRDKLLIHAHYNIFPLILQYMQW